MKRVICLLFLIYTGISFSLNGQLVFEDIIEAAENRDSDKLQREHLVKSGFFPEKIEKGYESWGYNAESGKALFWLHISKNDFNRISKVQVISWGHKIHSRLVEGIVKHCKYHDVKRHLEGTYYFIYLCRDLMEINIWEGEKDGVDFYIIDIYFTGQL